MPKSTQSTSGKATWKKPYADFPLSFHPPSGRLYKKIKGTRYYFGYADNWQAAIENYDDNRDRIQAGKKLRPIGSSDALKVRDLCNRFLTSKERQQQSGELSGRTFNDYKQTTDRLISQFGRSRLVADLAADDFEELRADIAKAYGPVRLGNEIQRVRTVFKFAFDNDLIEKPVRFGSAFKKPSRKVLRQVKNAVGPRMLEPEQLRMLLDAANQPIKTMMLLALNSGFGNNDVATLPKSTLNLDAGWIDFPRPKTGVARRTPLWPETVAALREWMAVCPEVKDEADADLLFVTKYGGNWSKDPSAITKQFRKLLDATALYRKGISFYALRHIFETIGGESLDQVAVNSLMGHVDESMAANYRQSISDDRLRAVADHVRAWLFAGQEGGAA